MESYFVRTVNGETTLDNFNEIHINDFVEVIKGRNIPRGVCGKVVAFFKNDYDTSHSPTNLVAQAYFDWRNSYFYHDKYFYSYNNSKVLLILSNGEKKYTYLNNLRKLPINMVFYEEPKDLGIAFVDYIKKYCTEEEQLNYNQGLEKVSDWAKMYN